MPLTKLFLACSVRRRGLEEPQSDELGGRADAWKVVSRVQQGFSGPVGLLLSRQHTHLQGTPAPPALSFKALSTGQDLILLAAGDRRRTRFGIDNS